MWAERSELREVGETSLFVDVTAPAPRLVIFGAVDYAAALCRLARAAGWRPYVCDPRSQFATPERFPDAEEVIAAWPEEAFARLGGIDRATYIAVLTHDPKLDDAALDARAALRGALRGRDGKPPRAGAAPRAAAGRRARRGAARARRRADRPRPRRAEPGGDRALDHGRGGGGAERARRAGGCRTPAGASTRWARDRAALGARLAARRRHPLRRRPSSSPSSTAGRCSSTRCGRWRRRRSTASSWCWARGAEEVTAAVDLHGAEPSVCERWEEGQSASLACGLAELADARPWWSRSATSRACRPRRSGG